MFYMSKVSPNTPGSNDRIASSFGQKSSLYQEFLAEREEILRHKWIESEKHGKDIGFERALLDWIRHYREGWRQARRGTGISTSLAGEGNQCNQ
jgi:hypothetical protein